MSNSKTETQKENQNENFMMKVAEFIVDKRNLIVLIYVILIIFSAFSRSWVKVENDLSYYLPADAETKIGLEIMDDEFVTFGSARLMVANITYDDAKALADTISERPEVQSLSFDDSTEHYNDASALFDVTFNYPEEDEKAKKALDSLVADLSDYDVFVSSTLDEDLSETIAKEMQVISSAAI